MEQWDVIIVGGGLAGLTSAIELARKRVKVMVIEKNSFPKHKVCGEYLSMEVVPYLYELGIDLDDAVAIDKLEISNSHGKQLQTNLPLGGVGISRYALDHRLFKSADFAGALILQSQVINIEFENDHFTLTTSDNGQYQATAVIGAFGKRSQLDKNLNRPFITKHAPWLGVKAHYRYEGFPDDLVGVHAFEGGYGGLSKNETGHVNFCYLANYGIFKKYKDIEEFNHQVVVQNPILKALLTEGEPLFNKPLSIAQVSFQKKQQVSNHILMGGDAAGLIHPLCGNGMAMAIHSGRMASELILRYLEDPKYDREQMEWAYSLNWKAAFGRRLRWGRQLQGLLLNPALSNVMIGSLARFEWLTKSIIRKTHGNPRQLV